MGTRAGIRPRVNAFRLRLPSLGNGTVVMVGELIGERYELKELVGKGGMSTVYSAYDSLLERHVALKILHDRFIDDDEYVKRFRHEARAVAQLSHPSIVTVIDRGEQDGRQFIVFELVEGENLKELVERTGPLPVRRVLELGLDVGGALAFAHASGLVHRDVKPQNVLIDGDGQPKVTDFGIARSLDTAGHTQTGTVLGTSHYIAPEQARGQRVDGQTDVYSFGVVLFELLTGAVPYAGDNFLTVAMRHVNDPVPNVLELRPDCPPRLASLVGAALAKEPGERPQGMKAVVAELRACLAALDARPDGDATMIIRRPSLPAAERPRRARAERRRMPVAVSLLGLLVLGAVGAALLFGLGGDGNGLTGGDSSASVTAVASYDPQGDDGAEHPELVAAATDGDASTSWATSTYFGSFAKDGVGIVVDAGDGASLAALTVTTTTPGFTAEIRSGASQDGPFEAVVSPSQSVEPSTTFPLDGGSARYYLVWITSLDGRARISEVTATG